MNNKNKVIYIACYGSKDTGGSESLHQLAQSLSSIGFETYVYYADKYDTPDGLKKYNVKKCMKIINDSDSILIVPETLTGLLLKNKKCEKYIWWLSWDFYFENFPKRYALRKIGNKKLSMFWPIVASLGIIKGSIYINNYKFQINDVKHIYNSEYVRGNLTEKGVLSEQMMYLCGPISTNYEISFEERERIRNNKQKGLIAYNPSKNRNFNEKIINFLKKNNQEFESVAIENMTLEKVKETLEKSDIYMDFGFFPGPERLPREAVMLGCKIITSTDGAALNSEDVKIPRSLKFDKKTKNIPFICNKIVEISNTSNYEEYDKYIKKVSSQIIEFNNDVRKIVDKWFKIP